MPRVYNKKHGSAPPGAYYIGRGSPLGNRHRVGFDGTRKEVIAKHEAETRQNPELMKLIHSLRGRDLVCFCKPKPCHGDWILAEANKPICEEVAKVRIGIFDIESDGLLDKITRVHCLHIRVIEDGIFGPVQRFRNNGRENTIRRGLELLSSMDIVVGHNIVSFDIPALEKIYPDWFLPENVIIRDTIVLAMMQKSNIKDSDYRAHERGLLEGKLIGNHGLEAWGQRLGIFKGDYAKIKEAEAKEKGITDKEEIIRYVWGTWNQDMDDYCVQDVEVTTVLWQKLQEMGWSEEATRLEHRIHYIMCLQEQFGFQFNVDKAKDLSEELETEYAKLSAEAIAHFGRWFAPKKKYKLQARPHFGEDESRKIWADVTVYKAKRNAKVIIDGVQVISEYSPDAPACAIELKEFNPNSRPQIIDRLQTIYDWKPVDFTENGTPEVNDDVLRTLAKDIPICEDLAELFFLSKLLGMVVNGDNAWLALVKEDGRIHGRVTVGGTISGRGSHSKPNCGQIPKVSVTDVKRKDGSWNPKVLDKVSGAPIADVFLPNGDPKKKIILKGRAGKYGFECRSLFTAPPGWVMMGCDLSGIELRCLAARLAEFDNGAYVDEVLNGDPHSRNQVAFGLDSRDNAKTCLYAIMYGGGDLKVGSIVMPPSASEEAMKARGKQLKANLQNGIPAFGQLIKKVGRLAGRGYLDGLDGRKLWVRSKHAALNLQLQSDAALISKLWVVFFFDLMHEHGYEWGRDWAQVAWVHDEIQASCRTKEIAEHAAELCKQAAKEAGEYFDYAAPVGADAKLGMNWAETH